MIHIENLKKSFSQIPVLIDVNLDIPKSETVVIIGRSGCGKSVLLKLIIGLLKPDGGRIVLDGTDITACDEAKLYTARRKLGILFQSSALFDSMTVADNLAFASRAQSRMTEGEIGERIKERLQLVGMPHAGDLKPAELSGGMKKRAALARALMLNPACMLYDEPTTGLDPIMADVINNMIIDCAKQLKVTSLIVTHDISSAFKVADRIAMLHDGRIIINGTPQEIRTSSDERVQQFIQGRADGPITPFQ